jgi:hypothetical protein
MAGSSPAMALFFVGFRGAAGHAAGVAARGLGSQAFKFS